MTTPAERVRYTCAGWNPLPSSGFATTTVAGRPASPIDWRTTTVLVVLSEPIQPPAFPTTSTPTPPTTAATSEVRATAPGRKADSL